ncbi:peptide deformylase [Corynebacterium sp. 320]|uniref:Peptide deformylase n=1 Tax=Corynebacterium zhongnanshanii TaxID=2768834 RepID=A0ABQ6VGC2_9CORY|nr:MULTISPECIES: peptide deformylase [Corynebacterium]KAB1503690.1 peptide deformylase [Corynebacterium sp. 320]KAB1553209.1 peptide deformylase [Corynebacterium sp. 321]KAB1553572.1 peptide deformylase [Corynebacterium sp. 319]KAB3523459.1 peptide deformylase [Corynebacterium zhongnanshanii]KAB3527826.1 peptide deformylase [Corynebacterium sp. 250]
MTVLQMRYFGDPVLRTVADEIPADQVGDQTLRTLVDDMLETMDAYGGVGLAANQVGITRRVFVYDCEGDRGHIINPEWEALGEETQTGPEGCLSVPGVGGEVTRAQRVRVTGVTVDGEPVDREVTDLLARCVQHETDHLDGIMFLQHLSSEQRKEAMKAIRTSEWFK